MWKTPTFSMPGIVRSMFLTLVGQLFQLVEVGAEDLDRVVALDAGERLHDVVADVLREVPVDAGQLPRQLGVHLLDQLVLGACAVCRREAWRRQPVLLDDLRPVASRGSSGTKNSTL